MEIVMALYVIAIVLGVVLIIAWTILPFAIIGTKPLLRKLLAEVQVTNALLERRMNVELRADDVHSRIG